MEIYLGCYVPWRREYLIQFKATMGGIGVRDRIDLHRVDEGRTQSY